MHLYILKRENRICSKEIWVSKKYNSTKVLQFSRIIHWTKIEKNPLFLRMCLRFLNSARMKRWKKQKRDIYAFCSLYRDRDNMRWRNNLDQGSPTLWTWEPLHRHKISRMVTCFTNASDITNLLSLYSVIYY